MSVKVRDIVVKDIITISNHKTVSSARTHMDYFGVDTLVVTHENEPVGMVTKSDIDKKIKELEMNPHQVLVEDIYSEPLIWVRYNTTLSEVVEIMNDENIKRVPIFGNLAHGPVLLGMYTVVNKEIVEEIAA